MKNEGEKGRIAGLCLGARRQWLEAVTSCLAGVLKGVLPGGAVGGGLGVTPAWQRRDGACGAGSPLWLFGPCWRNPGHTSLRAGTIMRQRDNKAFPCITI
jgi:hypothetical protein